MVTGEQGDEGRDDDRDDEAPRYSPLSGVARPRTGQSLRALLTLGLTFAVVLVVVLGITLRLPPGDFAQYISPLTGLAGLALGYWFGSEKRGS